MRSKMTHVMEENQLLLSTVRSLTASSNSKSNTPRSVVDRSMLLHAHTYYELLTPQQEGTYTCDVGTANLQIERNFRVDISGYLFLYEALAAGWLSSPWVRHYVSLTGTLLSYTKTPKNIESPVTPCTRVSVEVSSLPSFCAM